MTETLTVESARAELNKVEARARELRGFLRKHTAGGLTRGERQAAEEFVKAGTVQLAAARLGVRRDNFQARLNAACRKLGVDEQGLPAALGVDGFVL